jgi:hypothetical protein
LAPTKKNIEELKKQLKDQVAHAVQVAQAAQAASTPTPVGAGAGASS